MGLTDHIGCARLVLLTLALLMVWVPVAACLPLAEYKGGQAAHGTLPIIVRASLNSSFYRLAFIIIHLMIHPDQNEAWK